MKLELISFALCPYVQRSVITLKFKHTPFEITYIDLENPPGWFHAISPLGQVPVLKVNDDTILFESAVINEFVDEITPPSLHPTEPLQKAKERAWIEYGSSLLGEHYQMVMADRQEDLDAAATEFFDSLRRLEPVLQRGPYFRGARFGLVDSAYAPLFMRLFLSKVAMTDARWQEMPKVRAWGEALIAVPAVQESVRPGFAEEYVVYGKERGSLLLRQN